MDILSTKKQQNGDVCQLRILIWRGTVIFCEWKGKMSYSWSILKSNLDFIVNGENDNLSHKRYLDCCCCFISSIIFHSKIENSHILSFFHLTIIINYLLCLSFPRLACDLINERLPIVYPNKLARDYSSRTWKLWDLPNRLISSARFIILCK